MKKHLKCTRLNPKDYVCSPHVFRALTEGSYADCNAGYVGLENIAATFEEITCAACKQHAEIAHAASAKHRMSDVYLIKAYMKAHLLTQVEMAERLEMSQGSLSRILRRMCQPHPSTRVRIRKVCAGQPDVCTSMTRVAALENALRPLAEIARIRSLYEGPPCRSKRHSNNEHVHVEQHGYEANNALIITLGQCRKAAKLLGVKH